MTPGRQACGHASGTGSSWPSICSSDSPLVSGIMVFAQISCRIIIAQKKTNMYPASNALIAIGKTSVSSAAVIQCVKLPSACPAARWSFGKISEMNTQMMVPEPTACAPR